MLQIADITLREEEVERVEWWHGRLTLRLRWSLQELSVVLELPDEVLASWHAEDDPGAGIPVRLARWAWSYDRLKLILRREDIFPKGSDP